MAVQAAVLWRLAGVRASFERQLRVLRHKDGPALHPSSSLHPGAQRPALRAVSYHHKEAECIKHGGHTDTGSPGPLSLNAETKREVLWPVTSLSLSLSFPLLFFVPFHVCFFIFFYKCAHLFLCKCIHASVLQVSFSNEKSSSCTR